MCGKDCLEQHNSSKRFNYVQNHGQIAGVIRRQRKGHELNLGASACRCNDVARGCTKKKTGTTRTSKEEDTVVDIRHLVEYERRGGNEVTSQTRFKVEGIVARAKCL